MEKAQNGWSRKDALQALKAIALIESVAREILLPAKMQREISYETPKIEFLKYEKDLRWWEENKANGWFGVTLYHTPKGTQYPKKPKKPGRTYMGTEPNTDYFRRVCEAWKNDKGKKGIFANAMLSLLDNPYSAQKLRDVTLKYEVEFEEWGEIHYKEEQRRVSILDILNYYTIHFRDEKEVVLCKQIPNVLFSSKWAILMDAYADDSVELANILLRELAE